ncbi:YggU family protein [Gammaproteobacteria bacterium LSUCC0112]|nr:YggU family protein [Gammaproteobacteria bacterium LSUCC0112]
MSGTASHKEGSARWYRWQGDTLILYCKIQTRAGKDAFGELLGDQIKLRISAAPVDGKANAHLIKFLANEFAVPQHNISIIKGESSKQKQISISKPGRLPELADLKPAAS